MTVSSAYISFILILLLNFVQGTLTPHGNVFVNCGRTQTFTCNAPGEPIKWTTSGLRGISAGPFLARKESNRDLTDRFTSHDSGRNTQESVSTIIISGFSKSDNGGTIQCINARNSNVLGMASISVDLLPLPPPTNVTATVESCDVKLQWTQPSEPNDITTSVSCTPLSPGCAECTTSPCTITGLNPSTEYEFTVTLNSGECRANTSTTSARTMDPIVPSNLSAVAESCESITLQWTQPSEPNDITASVSCTPPSPGCAECTTSPCNITGLNPSTEYIFTVTLSSSVCGTSRNKTEAFQINASSCVAPNRTSNDTPVESLPSSLAALVLIPVVLLIPLIYPLGVLIAKFCCFRDKSYCEVFWCCGCCREDKSARFNSTEPMEPPHPGEEVKYQNVNKGKHTQFVTDREENKDQRVNRQKYVATYATVGQLGDDDGDVITDETIEQQGYEDWIKYAALDFSGDRKGNINVLNPITDEVTYTAV